MSQEEIQDDYEGRGGEFTRTVQINDDEFIIIKLTTEGIILDWYNIHEAEPMFTFGQAYDELGSTLRYLDRA